MHSSSQEQRHAIASVGDFQLNELLAFAGRQRDIR
jgi:hypothetical protein